MRAIKLSHPSKRVIGKVVVPGSKSESNRLLILKSLYFPDLEIFNLSDSRDTHQMISCLNDKGNFWYAGEAGTVMRFLTAYLAVQKGKEYVLQGTARMHERPIGLLVEALQQLGADIQYLKKEGFPPLKILGKKLKGGEISIDGSVSSQFISALMMIGPGLEDGLKIRMKGLSVSAPYIYLTASLMRRMGFKIKLSSDLIEVEAYVPKGPAGLAVEPDWSAASYWYSLALVAEKVEIYLPGFRQHSLQGDAFISGLFEPLGVRSLYIGSGFRLKKEERKEANFNINLIHNPDLAQTMVVAYASQNIQATITGLQTLRIKETDRIYALQKELEKTGAKLETGEDYIRILEGVKTVEGLSFETYQDHRMAMSLAPLSLLGEIEIRNPGVVEKSYQSFGNILNPWAFC